MVNILSRTPTTLEEQNRGKAHSKEPLASINMEPLKSRTMPLVISQLTQINFWRENANNKGLGEGKMTHLFLPLAVF